ncbi:stromal membrane-associated protein 1 [Zalerion maritima]|uniref:Stromal membrane-associated protein 1 n=1 Tax=Zalerion maritima TaxID=339359 RepID=A0AAD5RL82_9PEZI|nr:stromal membrane-associated protein 1 [Zalerion maritima]
MSRRPPNPAAERAAKNQATIKSLLKLEANKICADCKRNKHPRWASWNLGVFICIRCSGIHRGMGTHISRVKSVDLDAWTDEQLQSILSWGNARANKYWEAKLASGHVPSESKIENFIRTKYELKRWVMEGPMPDPASLDVEEDDHIPLSVVKEKQVIDRRESLRKTSVGSTGRKTSAGTSSAAGDLLGSDDIPARTNTAPPISRPPPPKAEAAPPKTAVTKDSLLGLDFLGSETNAPPRPSSTASSQSRPDLKQSILSLYASAPRPQHQSQQSTSSFGGMASPTLPLQQQTQRGSTSGLQDAFSSLSFGSSMPSAAPAKSPPPPAVDPFASFGSATSSRPAAKSSTSTSSFGGLAGGSFFENKPAANPTATSHQKQPSNNAFDPFSAFSSPSANTKPAAPAPTASTTATSSAGFGDLFDLSAPSVPAPAPPPAPAAFAQPAAQPAPSSVFNLSTPASKAAPAPTTTSTTSSNAMGGFSGANFSGADVWGGGNEWNTPAAEPAPAAAPKSPATQSKPTTKDFGWGSGGLANTPIVPGASGGFNTAGPKVAQDEEFGGWASSTGTAAKPPAGGGGGSGSGFGGGNNEDLFSNVWQ